MSSYKKAEGGWWDLDGAITSCIGAWQGISVASIDDSYVNLANPGTYNLTVVGAGVSWDTSYGWTGGSNANKLSTGIDGTSIDDTWTYIARYTELANTASAVNYAIGHPTYLNGANHSYGISKHYANHSVGIGTKTYSISGRTAGTDALAGADVYHSGTWKATLSGYDADVTSGTLPIAGTPGKVQAAAIYNAVLTSDQISALTTAMNAL